MDEDEKKEKEEKEKEDKALMIAIQELNIEGFVTITDDENNEGDTFSITDKGREVAIKLLNELPVKDMILLMILVRERSEEFLEFRGTEEPNSG